MSILSALKKKFNAKGGNIEEAIKTMEVGGGSSDDTVVAKFLITATDNATRLPTAITQTTNYLGQQLYTASQDGKNVTAILHWNGSPVYYSKSLTSFLYVPYGPAGMAFTFLYQKKYGSTISTGDYKLLRFYVDYNTTNVTDIKIEDISLGQGGSTQLPVIHIYEIPGATTTYKMDESYSDLTTIVSGYSDGVDALAYISPVPGIIGTQVVHISGAFGSSPISITRRSFNVLSDGSMNFTTTTYNVSSNNSIERILNSRFIEA